MDDGPWTSPGGFGWFLGAWLVMMPAMMPPSVAPTVALYSRMARARSHLAPLPFAAGSFIAWWLWRKAAARGLVARGSPNARD